MYAGFSQLMVALQDPGVVDVKDERKFALKMINVWSEDERFRDKTYL